MVPMKLKLKGFLSYRDEAEFDFSADNNRLWMLSGDNGAGKSSVFDGITFALFKQHRHGGQNARGLVNTQSDAASVEFEFSTNGVLYRSQRGIKRKSGSVSGKLLRWDGANWHAISEGDECTGHIEQILGLKYESFTMSVFLPQNGENSIVKADPKGRFELLKRIMNLRDYEILCDLASKREAGLTGVVKNFALRLIGNSLPVVTDEEITNAISAAEIASQEYSSAQKMRDHCAVMVTHAKNFDDWKMRLTTLSGEISQIETVIAEADAVRKHAMRHRELASILPVLRVVLKAHDALTGAKAKHARHLEQRSVMCHDLVHELGLDVTVDVGVIREALEKKCNKTDLAERFFPAVEAFCNARNEAFTATSDWKNKSAQADAPQLDSFDVSGREYIETETTTRAALERAREEKGRCQGVKTDIEERLVVLVDGGEAAMCRICGQPLTPEMREEQLQALQGNLLNASKALSTATSTERQLQESLTRAVEQLKAADSKYSASVRAWENATKDAASARIICERKWQLSHEAKSRVNEATRKRLSGEIEGYPTPADLQAMKSLAESAERWREKHKDWKGIEQVIDQWQAGVEERSRTLSEDTGALPAAWRDHPAIRVETELARLESECEMTQTAVQMLEGLDNAEYELTVKRSEATNLSRQMESLPDDARLGLPEAEEKLYVAKEIARDTEIAERSALNHRDALRRQQSEREVVQKEYDDTIRDRDLWKFLADCLGNEGLQRELIRNAEQLITCKANETLAQLSGGTLHLSESKAIEGRNANTALNLVCANTMLPGEPILLKGLSGSQQFRVSVALALALGQCVVGGQTRLRSVMIDEGFGSLDPKNLEGMADVMHRLGETLERVVIVSHQETFANRFPNRYHISLEGETSRVNRVQLS